MTPHETQVLHVLGIASLRDLDKLLIYVFFHGASFSLVVCIWPTHKFNKGAFVVLFSASVVIFMSVFFFLRVACFLARPDP